jgi:hypothetical protein
VACLGRTLTCSSPLNNATVQSAESTQRRAVASRSISIDVRSSTFSKLWVSLHRVRSAKPESLNADVTISGKISFSTRCRRSSGCKAGSVSKYSCSTSRWLGWAAMPVASDFANRPGGIKVRNREARSTVRLKDNGDSVLVCVDRPSSAGVVPCNTTKTHKRCFQ